MSSCVDSGCIPVYIKVEGGKVQTYEIQDGFIYIYMDGQLSRITRDTSEHREYLDKHGFTWHNKNKR